MGRHLCQGDLHAIRIAPLRAAGLITPDTTSVTLSLAGVVFSADIYLQRMGNGGSWSLFLCPTCGQKCRVLRLLNTKDEPNKIICRRCCLERSIGVWNWYTKGRGYLRAIRRARIRIPILKERLNNPPPRDRSVYWTDLRRRKRLEADLARCEWLVAQRINWKGTQRLD
jgi:hypothetical protein